MKKLGLILFGLGIVSMIIQNTFYGYVDEAGVLHDSLFLPLGVLLIFLGPAVWFVGDVINKK